MVWFETEISFDSKLCD